MNEIFNFFEEELGGKDFYATLQQKSIDSPELYNQTIIFPTNKSSKSLFNFEHPKVNSGDTRIDMPILCGNINSKNRVLILGLEPRHTNDMYNILRIQNKVFATPFGIDKWYSLSKQNIYGSAFENFLNRDALFLFSDFVKEYDVPDPNTKGLNDVKARSNFEKNFTNKYQSVLEKEIKLFDPSLIIGLGKVDISKKIEKSWLKEFKINVVSHPTNGNYHRMQIEMTELFKQI
jgi:hypothetical protein